MDTVDELRRWLADYSRRLKTVKMPGALPESTQREFDKFMVCCLSIFFGYHCISSVNVKRYVSKH